MIETTTKSKNEGRLGYLFNKIKKKEAESKILQKHTLEDIQKEIKRIGVEEASKLTEIPPFIINSFIRYWNNDKPKGYPPSQTQAVMLIKGLFKL